MSGLSMQITVDYSSRGQPRTYAGEEWIGTLSYSYTRGGVEAKWLPSVADVRAHLALLVHPWKEDGEGDWFNVRLHDLSEIEPGRWHFDLRKPYDD